jgi:hypothetical protein
MVNIKEKSFSFINLLKALAIHRANALKHSNNIQNHSKFGITLGIESSSTMNAGYCTLFLIKIDLWSRGGLPIDRSPWNTDPS